MVLKFMISMLILRTSYYCDFLPAESIRMGISQQSALASTLGALCRLWFFRLWSFTANTDAVDVGSFDSGVCQVGPQTLGFPAVAVESALSTAAPAAWEQIRQGKAGGNKCRHPPGRQQVPTPPGRQQVPTRMWPAVNLQKGRAISEVGHRNQS